MLNKQEAEQMAGENILPFWQGMADRENGGFYGEADFYGKANKAADKGCVLNSRLLWTFSAAYRIFSGEQYIECAARARDFLSSSFLDREHGGLYWLVDNRGRPLNTRKQFYNIAFGIYALSEHYLAVKDQSSLELALSLFDVMEKYGLDAKEGGYIEARTREWNDIDDFRLSSKEINCPKSMNTNLHVLEAYTNLSRASSGDNRVRKALEDVLRITLDKIAGPSGHFRLFFDMNWNSLSKDVSFGHDIEGSWLLYEAALAAGNENLIGEVKQTALEIADVVLAAVDHENGGLFSACDEAGQIYPKKEWWPQAEAVVGFYNAYELTKEQKYFDAADNIWKYIKKHFADSVHGEWHNELHPDNTPDTAMPKAGFWKCPYHNARACFEIIRRQSF